MEQWIELIQNKFWDGINMIPESVNIGRYSVIGIIVAVGVFLSLMLVIFTKIRKKVNYEKELNVISLEVMSAAKESANCEKFINQCLDIICRMFEAQSYGFYVYDSKNDIYTLKSVRYSKSDLNEIGPSYSGLVPFEKEQYLQPISIPNQGISELTNIISQGKVSLLEIPFGSKNALIRIYPVKKILNKTRKKLDYFAQMAGITFDIIIESDTVKNKIYTFTASDSAVNKVVNTFGSVDGLLFTFIGVCLKKTGADSGFFIKKLPEELKPLCFVNIPEEFEEDILSNQEGIINIISLLNNKEILHLHKSTPDFYKLPPYFTINNIETVVLSNVESGDEKGYMVLLYKEGNSEKDFSTEKIKSLQYIQIKFHDIFGVQNIIKSLSDAFHGTLQGMMQLIDNIQPHSVGYSELMARFSYIIADELGLEEDVKKDIYLAAYLSNIGVLGLSNNVFFKTGKYSDTEYEAMKFHAEAGARIIEASLGSKRVADYVRYHHERMDGLGYPTGIKGNEIPQGSRIIAVVQFFLAKLNGRQGRDPVSFNEALESLEMSIDTQLDRECVNALIRWVNVKRNSTPNRERSLGFCWDMRCSTMEICMDCPVYMKEDVNCWDFEKKGIKCSQHGNSCKTCYIRTEVLGR